MTHHRTMTARLGSRLAWGGAAFVCLIVAIAGALALGNLPAFRDPELIGSLAQAVVPTLAIVFVGALIASRLPHNRMGWILLSAAAVNGITALLAEYQVHTLLVVKGSLPAVEWVAWLNSLVSGITYPAMVVLLMLFFPNGRLPSGRWRWLIWAIAAYTFLNALVGVLDPVAIQSAGLPPVRNPTGLAPFKGLEAGPLGWVSFFGAMVIVLTAVASLVVRLRRASSEERQQVRWVVYALGVATILNVLLSLSTLFLPPSPQGRIIGNVVSNLLIVLGFGVALPAAIGVAILKYRLYDIDIVINRTIVFGALAAFITAAYVGIVVGIGTLIGSGGRNNVVLSIAATALVAVAFQPVRERVQRLANHLIYGKRATPYEVMADFSERMSETLSPDEILPRMAEAAARGVGAEAARVSVKLPDGSDRAIWWPREQSVETLRHRVPANYHDQLVGEIAVGKTQSASIAPADAKLLADLATQAGLVLHNVRLTAELQARLDELTGQAGTVRASRQRLVTAATAERQRLEQHIRSGAEAELAALAAKLPAIDPVLDADPQQAAAALEGLTGDLHRTLDGLRRLAHGIYPPLLRDKGLPAALQSLVARDVPSGTVESDLVGRYPSEVEATIYFCCREALQAAGDHVTVRLRHLDDGVEFSVLGTRAEPNGRRQDMEDRMDAVGGSLVVTGDTVIGRIPVGLVEVAG
jgi:signal transduction histidine kinase